MNKTATYIASLFVVDLSESQRTVLADLIDEALSTAQREAQAAENEAAAKHIEGIQINANNEDSKAIVPWMNDFKQFVAAGVRARMLPTKSDKFADKCCGGHCGCHDSEKAPVVQPVCPT